MTTTTQTDALSRFCSVCAKQAGLDPAGSTYSYKHVLAVEIPLPWPESMYSEPGVLPQEILDLGKLIVDAYQRGEPLHIGTLAIAPDKAYSRAGYRRVISYQRPAGPFATYTQTEYLVPENETGPLCWALLVAHDQLPRFADYHLPPSNSRDLLVCTHGAVDAACAKFGFPAYRHLRSLADASNGQLRVWRVSHFGGHVFAPTLIDMPEFRSWAYVEREVTEQIALHKGDIASFRNCYRGWGGLEHPMLQVAERELLMRHGWAWRDYLKTGSVLTQKEGVNFGDEEGDPVWAEVRIDYAAPDGSECGAYIARVERTGHIECVYSTSATTTYAYPQYTVTSLERADEPR